MPSAVPVSAGPTRLPVSQLTATIEKLAEPWLRQINELDAVPGIGTICAQDVIAELGTDMARSTRMLSRWACVRSAGICR